MTGFAHVARLAVTLDLEGEKRVVGTLAWSQRERRAYFEYAPAFLASPLPLSPRSLPATAGLKAADPAIFEGLHGLFDDSLPDGWGRRLLDRHVGQLGHDHRLLTPLDRLAYVGSGGMGALAYEPEMEDGVAEAPALDLDWLARQSALVEREAPAADVEVLRGAAGGSGGARPKIVCLLNPETDRILRDAGPPYPTGFVPWMVKFRGVEDHRSIGREEYAYALMAGAAGITMPATRLMVTAKGAAYFAAERFDRSPAGRRHVHSLSGLLGVDHRTPALDYRTLLQVTQALTQDARCVAQVVARMAFNVLARNRDDHARNHAFLMTADGAWVPTPAYDVTFSVGPGGEHQMTVGGEGRAPTLRHVTGLAREFTLPKGELDAILDRVAEAVRGWPTHAGTAGLSVRRTAEMQKVLSEAVRR